MAETNSLLNCRRGNPTASSNLALSASQKSNVLTLLFFCCLSSLAACGHARGKQQKKYLRSKFFGLQGRPQQRRDLQSRPFKQPPSLAACGHKYCPISSSTVCRKGHRAHYPCLSPNWKLRLTMSPAHLRYCQSPCCYPKLTANKVQ